MKTGVPRRARFICGISCGLTPGSLLEESDVYKAVELTKPTIEQEKKTTDVEVAATINELTLGIERATRAGDLPLVNLLRKRIAEMLDEPLPDLTELPKATGPFGRPLQEPGLPPVEDENADAET